MGVSDSVTADRTEWKKKIRVALGDCCDTLDINYLYDKISFARAASNLEKYETLHYYPTCEGRYEKLTKEVIPRLTRKINDLSADLQKKCIEKHHSKSDDKILKDTINNLLKKLVLESTTDYLTRVSKNEGTVVPDNVTETSLTTNAITSQKPTKVTPKKLQPTALYKAILEENLVDNKSEPTIDVEVNTHDFTEPFASITLIKEDLEKEDKNPIKNIFLDNELPLLHCYKGSSNDATSQKSIKVLPKILRPTALYENILENNLVDNKTEPTKDIEVNTQDFTDSCASITLIKEDLEKEDKNPIKNIFLDNELPLLHCYKGSSNDATSQKSIKVLPKILRPIALYENILENNLVDNKTEPTKDIEVNTQDFTDSCASITLIKEDLEKEDKNPIKNILSDDELFLLHCYKGSSNDITSQNPLKEPTKKLRPTALYKTILEKTLVDNKIQPTIQIDIEVNTQSDLTESGSSITLKPDIEENDKNSINNILSDDELLPFQKGRIFSIKNVKQTLDEEICPRYKVFVMDRQKVPRHDQQPLGDGSRSNNSNLSTPSQQSTRNVKATLVTLNLITSKKRKSASITKKYQKPKKKSTVVKSDSLKSILGHHSPEIKRTEKNKKSKTQAVGTSNCRSVKLSCNTRALQTEIRGKVPPKLPLRFKTNLPKASRDQELIVLKQPEESGSHDDFIPPVAFKNLATNANIIQIEELSEDVDVDDNKIKETKQEPQQIAEAFETGEWFETATMRSKSDSIIGLPTRLPTHIIKNSISSCTLCSKCTLPAKESTESNLQDSLCSRETLKAFKKKKSDQRKSTSSGFVAALDKVKYLDRFDSPDDFDELFQQFLEIKASVDREKSK